jgi:DNA polymerase I-like protein with 3'-5' exonuclease and polymerase domains
VHNYIITDEETLAEARDYFLSQPAFSFDFEAAGDNRGIPHLNTLTWLSMATRGAVCVIPFGHPIGTEQVGVYKEPKLCADGKIRNYSKPIWAPPPPQLARETVFGILEPLFFSETVTKVAHGAVYDLASMYKYYGKQVPQPFDDTIILAWLTNENRNRYGLKYLVKDLYRYTYDDENVGRCVEKYPFATVAKYSYMDALYCWALYNRFLPQIEQEGLEAVHAVEISVLEVLVSMRLTGAKVDVPRLRELRGELAERLEKEKGAVYRAAGAPFNINSTPQKQKLLFGPRSEGGQGLKPWKLTTKGKEVWEEIKPSDSSYNTRPKPGELGIQYYSTDDEVLAGFPDNPLAASLRDYQETSKVLGTYVLGYLGDSDNDKKPCRIFDNRIFADFVQYGAATGRFSCREPNLQNIPRPDSDLGKIVRGIFIAEEGHKLIVADFGQIELVVLAHYLGRGRLFEGFLQGIDPHTATAATIFRKRVEQVIKDERQIAKNINFAIVFGAGANKVASMCGKDVDFIKGVLSDHRELFPEIYAFREQVLSVCKSRRPPYVSTLSGRRRRLPRIFAHDEGLRKYTERQAFNSVIQGGAADLNKIALVRAYQDQRRTADMNLTLTVHDEMVMSVPEDRADLGEQIIREAMTGEGIQKMIRVPLSIDVKVVDRWSEAK